MNRFPHSSNLYNNKYIEHSRRNPAASRLLRGAMTIFAGVFAFFSSCTVCADVVTLHTGDELFGTIQTVGTEGIRLEKDGAVQTLAASQVMKLEFEHLRMIPGETTPESIQSPVMRAALASPATEAEYPEALLVNLLDEDRYELQADGTWVHTSHDAFTVLKEAARDTANRSFSYFPDLERFDIAYARSVTPSSGDGLLGFLNKTAGSVRYVSDRTIADEQDFADTPLYARRHTVKYAIPEVNPGSIVESVVKLHREKKDPFKPFYVEKYFRGDEPKKLCRLIVSLPAELELLFAIEERGFAVSHQRTVEGTRVVHTFTASNTTPVLPEPLMPGFARVAPRVMCALKDSWERIAADYSAALDELRGKALADTGIASLAHRLTQGATTHEAKARALFLHVAREISAIGISPGQFTPVPIAPEKVLAARQGTYFDKSFLYSVLLDAAKVPNRLLLVTAHDDGAWRDDLPNIRQGMNLAVEIPGLDGPLGMNAPINEYTGPDVRPAFLQGAEGIRLPGGTPVSLAMIAPEGEAQHSEITAEILENGTLKYRETDRVTGTAEADLRTFRSLRQEEIEKTFQQIVHGDFPGARLTGVRFENLDDLTKPLSVEFGMEVPEFALKSGDDLLVFPIPVMKSSYKASEVGAVERRENLAWETFNHAEQTISVKLPPGYSVYALPQGTTAWADGFLYASSVGFAADTLRFRDLYRRTVRELPATKYESYKRFVEERSKTPTQWIVIRRTPAPRE